MARTCDSAADHISSFAHTRPTNLSEINLQKCDLLTVRIARATENILDFDLLIAKYQIGTTRLMVSYKLPRRCSCL